MFGFVVGFSASCNDLMFALYIKLSVFNNVVEVFDCIAEEFVFIDLQGNVGINKGCKKFMDVLDVIFD